MTLNTSTTSLHQAQQTEGLDDRENKRVCVTGPQHALRGQCLVLVRRIVKHKQAYVVLRLANGSTQLVREEQTSAVQADLQSAAGLLLTVSALRMLSSMVAELHLATSKEATNDRTTAHDTLDNDPTTSAKTSGASVGRPAPPPSSGARDTSKRRNP